MVLQPKPIRKPDPDLRVIRRQISFGTGSSGFGSIKKKAQEAVDAHAAAEAASASAAGSSKAKINLPPPVAEESSVSNFEAATGSNTVRQNKLYFFYSSSSYFGLWID